MAWRDQLRKASFRRAAFFVDSAEGSFGRRTVTHEYPLRDRPYVEDLGRKARTFTLEAYVLGDEYFAARDALIAAIEQAGPGELVHPYLGDLRVAITESRLRETREEGLLARFTLQCVEAGENVFPRAQTDTGARVAQRADGAITAAAQDFAAKFSVDKLPEFVSRAAQDIVSTGAAGGVLNQLDAAAGTIPVMPANFAAWKSDLGDFEADLPSIVKNAETLADKLTGMIGRVQVFVRDPRQAVTDAATEYIRVTTKGLLGSASPAPNAALRIYRKFYDFGVKLGSITQTTRARQQQAANQAALTNIVRRTAVIEATRVSAGVQFESFDDAVAVRTELAGEIDGLLEQADDDPVYTALADLQAAMVEDIAVRGADLARVVRFTPQVTQPALVIAYELYGDPARDEEIVARNRIVHPGFVPGGQALEVLI